MRVNLMLTCLADAFYGSIGVATVKVLEHAGCEVQFPASQTCCGQPPFNAGDWDSARQMAQRALEVFAEDVPVVTPSSSCAAMLRHGYGQLGLKAPQCFELSEFLDQVVGLKEWSPLKTERNVVWHPSCHCRGIGNSLSAPKLMSLVGNLSVHPLPDADQCCGFGGSFSMSHPHSSVAIGVEKLSRVRQTGYHELVSGDAGCLMHLSAVAREQGLDMAFTHWAVVMAEAL